jgi:hypothetical protein
VQSAKLLDQERDIIEFYDVGKNVSEDSEDAVGRRVGR